MYDQALADFAALRAELGAHTLVLEMPPEDGAARLEVEAAARDMGVRSLSGEASGGRSERARLAVAHLAEADVLDAGLVAGLSPSALPRPGQRAELWGLRWQVRTVRRLGYARPGILRLELTRAENRRGGR